MDEHTDAKILVNAQAEKITEVLVEMCLFVGIVFTMIVCPLACGLC